MPNQSEKYINSLNSSLPPFMSIRNNAPPQYAGRQTQYQAEKKRIFDAERAYLATDYVLCRVQGLIPEDFYAWTETYIRLSDVSTQSVTAFDAKQYDDFKEVLFVDPAIEYVPVGAYLECMGSIWLVVNPGNMSGALADTVIARCRAHYNFYDDYGNVLQEPLVIDRRTMLSNRNESPENLVLAEGYFNVKCQKNKYTAELNDNSRLILGKYAYHITGYTDFFEEFTFDDESAHIITFAVRREEPQVNDDMENKIADGLLYHWNATISGNHKIEVGEETQFTAHVVKNGTELTDIETTWEFASSDESIATIDENGIVRGISEGSVNISARLKENPELFTSIYIEVQATAGSGMRYVGVVPTTLTQFTSVKIEAEYYGSDATGTEQFEWQFAGADPNDYSVSIADDKRSCEVECISACPTPLRIIAKYNNYLALTYIVLEGY